MPVVLSTGEYMEDKVYKVEPLNDNILVDLITPSNKIGNIELPEGYNEGKTRVGKVISVNKDSNLKKDDLVIFPAYAVGHEIGTVYAECVRKIISEKDLLGKIV